MGIFDSLAKDAGIPRNDAIVTVKKLETKQQEQNNKFSETPVVS